MCWIPFGVQGRGAFRLHSRSGLRCVSKNSVMFDGPTMLGCVLRWPAIDRKFVIFGHDGSGCDEVMMFLPSMKRNNICDLAPTCFFAIPQIFLKTILKTKNSAIWRGAYSFHFSPLDVLGCPGCSLGCAHCTCRSLQGANILICEWFSPAPSDEFQVSAFL